MPHTNEVTIAIALGRRATYPSWAATDLLELENKWKEVLRGTLTIEEFAQACSVLVQACALRSVKDKDSVALLQFRPNPSGIATVRAKAVPEGSPAVRRPYTEYNYCSFKRFRRRIEDLQTKAPLEPLTITEKQTAMSSISSLLGFGSYSKAASSGPNPPGTPAPKPPPSTAAKSSSSSSSSARKPPSSSKKVRFSETAPKAPPTENDPAVLGLLKSQEMETAALAEAQKDFTDSQAQLAETISSKNVKMAEDMSNKNAKMVDDTTTKNANMVEKTSSQNRQLALQLSDQAAKVFEKRVAETKESGKKARKAIERHVQKGKRLFHSEDDDDEDDNSFLSANEDEEDFMDDNQDAVDNDEDDQHFMDADDDAMDDDEEDAMEDRKPAAVIFDSEEDEDEFDEEDEDEIEEEDEDEIEEEASSPKKYTYHVYLDNAQQSNLNAPFYTPTKPKVGMKLRVEGVEYQAVRIEENTFEDISKVFVTATSPDDEDEIEEEGVLGAGAQLLGTESLGTKTNKKKEETRAEKRERAKVIGAKAAGQKAKTVASKPAATKPASSKPASSKPASSKPAASKPAATKPASSKPASSKPAATKPVAAKPASSKPAAAKPVATKPAATKRAAPSEKTGPRRSARLKK